MGCVYVLGFGFVCVAAEHQSDRGGAGVVRWCVCCVEGVSLAPNSDHDDCSHFSIELEKRKF